MKKKYDLEIKILVVGESEVGKTCLNQRYIDDIFASTINTISVDFKIKYIQILDKTIKLFLYDTAG